MRFKTSPVVRAFVVCAVAALPALASSGPVVYWNEQAVKSIAIGRPGTAGVFDVAIVQAAVHDSIQAIEGSYRPYAYSDESRRGLGTTKAAVAAATYKTLTLLYPAQVPQLTTLFNDYVAANGLAGDPALETGEAAAAFVHSRHYKPVFATTPFHGRNETGQWRSTVPMALLWVATTQPFALRHPAQFRPGPPPRLDSSRYAREYDEVKRIGSKAGHPNEGTEIARFWSVEYINQWNEALRDAVTRHVSSPGEAARLFALANISAADAFIAIWDCKYHYNYWRPSTAIVQGDSDGNRKTDGDINWLPLINDPAYPDYVSGANGLSGAYTTAMALFFRRNDVDFTIRTTSPLVTNQARHYTRISDAIQEVIDARIYLGIHFRTADVEGALLGGKVALYTYLTQLRPQD